MWAKSALQRAKELGHARKKTITMLQALPHDLSEVQYTRGLEHILPLNDSRRLHACCPSKRRNYDSMIRKVTLWRRGVISNRLSMHGSAETKIQLLVSALPCIDGRLLITPRLHKCQF